MYSKYMKTEESRPLKDVLIYPYLPLHIRHLNQFKYSCPQDGKKQETKPSPQKDYTLIRLFISIN